jgi:hypothetical protein
LAQISPDTFRRLRLPTYVVAALLSVVPIVEVFVNSLPIRISDPSWRLAVVAVATSAATTVLLSLLLVFVVGILADRVGALWFVGAACGCIALLSVIAAGSFALDALQMRGQVKEAMAARYNIASLWALAKIGLASVASLVLAVSAFRAAKSVQRATERLSRSPSSVLVSSAMAPGLVAGRRPTRPSPGSGQAAGVATASDGGEGATDLSEA